jgi:Protein of unknown function (DUF3108)
MAERGLAAIMLGLAAAAAVPVHAAAAAPLDVRYEAFAAGFPVARFDFRLKEASGSYVVDGEIRTEGLLRLFYRVNLQTASEGALAAAAVAPRSHEQVMVAGGKDREAHLLYPGDGRVLAQLVPPEDSGRPKPTPQQILDTMDPLSAVLAIGHYAARTGSCGGRFAVFDGRRRYDVVLSDEGSERIVAAPAVAFDGMARRCRVAAVKIAGFSNDLDYAPHTTMARAWLASPRAGAPALPLRIDFDSSWGLVEVRMTAVGK